MGVGANDLVERLESALAPWMAKKSEPLDLGEAFSPRDNSAPLQELERKRLYAYSLAKLRPRCTELAAMGENSGRNTAAYKLAAAIGRYVHHGIIARKEAADEILAACEQNGLIKEDGRASVVATIRSGLHSARNDPLPALPDRRSSKERTVKQTNVGDHVDGRPKRQGSPQLTGKREPRIYLVPFQEIRLGTRRRDLVARLIPRVGLIIVWGPPKCGKSFWAFDLAMHVALGWEYRGRRVHQGPVVYCAFEGQTGIEARIEAFRQRYLAEESAEPPPFYLEPVTLNLVAEHQDLIAAIRHQLSGIEPVAVVLDTLNRSMQGSESSDEDMSAYIKAADTIRETFQCAVIIVHHCGIEGSRPRGHTSLTGAADAQLSVKRDGADNIIVEVEFAKDSVQGDVIASRLEVIEVGLDDDGQPITSCVVVPVPGYVPPLPKARRRLPDAVQIALKALQKAISEAGEISPSNEHIPPNTKTVTRTLWRRYAYAGGISDSEEDDARRMAFRRASERLSAEGMVGIWNEQCWPIAEKPHGRTDEQSRTGSGVFGGVQGRTNTNTTP